jgi:hypothetical protein
MMKGDVSIQFQVSRDLMNVHRKDLQDRIAHEGWGKMFLEARNHDGHWGTSFYHPKWKSSHYTLLDLKNLGISTHNNSIKETLGLILLTQKGSDGGLNPCKSIHNSDVCVNGMALNYLSYFGVPEEELHSIIDFIVSQQLHDGGFNCNYNQSGARHSSLHSTISILEGITEYEKNGYSYRLKKLKKIKDQAVEFILKHRLYKSDRTGETIHKNFMKLPYPSRWKYDILRALDYFQYAQIPYDNRMDDALEHLMKKKRKDNRWNVQARHPGKIHFEMEKAGKPSRWNTLRAMRVLNHYTNWI